MEMLRGTSLFSNVGVAEAYFKDIGIKIKVANEIDEKRADFLFTLVSGNPYDLWRYN
ncbi:hypothetical protein KOG77_002390 [Streptococcus oralis]